MNILRGIIMAFSTFSRIPVPRVAWKDENLRYMLCALPLVGVCIGALLLGWQYLCQRLRLGDTLFAAGMTLLPVLVTGGIHLDGFCDTVDALASHASPERKREILKDPHAGAFAVIFACVYFLAYFALCSELARTRETVLLLACTFVLSRAAGGFAAVCFPLGGEGGMLHSVRTAARSRIVGGVLAVTFALCTAAMVSIRLQTGVVTAGIAVLCAAYVRILSVRAFGGMRGDLVGYLIAVSELMTLAGIILVQEVFI